jgi:DNA-binding response OmpR family regulator
MAEILIVEDDRDMRTFLTDVLKENGHRVLKAANGMQALRVLLKRSPDLLLTDIVMPRIDGLGLLQVLNPNASSPGLKIIAISGAANQSALEAAANMGAHKVLTKPFSGHEVLEAVRTVLTG